MNARLSFVYVLSPLHAGTGQGVGVIDLPIAREKSTGIPFLPGSSLKGALRDRCADEALRVDVFGPDRPDAAEHAGSVQITDQRLLLLPVRSFKGTFAWVTSPFLLRRLARATSDAGLAAAPDLPTEPAVDACLIPEAGSQIVMAHGDPPRNTAFLEDLDLPADGQQAVSAWARWLGERVFGDDDADWRDVLAARLCIVHDDVMAFLMEGATEIMARIKLQAAHKTVEKGGLWYEEALPAETVLTGLALATPVRADAARVFRALADLTADAIQLGGKATVGRGVCRVRFVE